MITPHSAHPGVVIPAGFYPGDVPSWTGFDTAMEAPSVANLSRSLTLSSVTSTCTASYNGKDGTATAWPADGAGSNFAVTGTGTAPSSGGGSPLMGAVDDSTYPGASTTKYYELTGATMDPSPTNKVLIVEVLARYGYPSPAVSTVLVNRNGKSYVDTTAGWCIGPNNNGHVYWSLGDGTTSQYAVTGTGANAGQWGYFLFAYRYNGDGTSQVYGAYNGTKVIYTAAKAVGDITPPTPATATARLFASHGGGERLAHLRVWAPECGALSESELDAVAAKRFRALVGSRPQYSTSGRDTAPDIGRRNCSATLEKYNATTSAVEYYTVGANWMRCESWLDTATGEVVMGYRCEVENTNTARYSRTGASWTLADAGDSIATGVDGPWGPGSAWGLICDSDNVQHSMRVINGATGAATTNTGVRLLLKAGAAPWAALYDSQTLNLIYFNMTTHVKGSGTVGGYSSPTPVITEKGGGWVEVSWNGSSSGSAGSIYVQPCDNDNVLTYSGGDGATVAINCAAVHCEALNTVACSSATMSSWIDTTTSSAARVKDELRWAHLGPDGRSGALVVDVISRGGEIPVQWIPLYVYKGGTDRSYLLQSAGEAWSTYCSTDGVATAPAVAIDGAVRRLGASWSSTSGVGQWMNGTKVGSDSAYTGWDGQTIYVCLSMAVNSALQPTTPTLIRRAVVYNRQPADMAKVTRLSA